MGALLVICLLTFASMFTTLSGFLESLIHGSNKSNPDVFCIMEHCGSQSRACALDSNCRRNMECILSCGLANQSCMYKCMSKYGDATFDAFMKCLVDDFQCLTLEPPNPGFRCKPPTDKVLANFSLDMLEGSWYVVRGLNPDYDCFDCQISTYSPTPKSRNFTLGEMYNVTMINGSSRRLETTQQMQQREETKGLVDSTDQMMGLVMHQEWYYLDFAANGNYVVAYYCGHMSSNWWYEGGVVYSRQPTLGPLDVANVASFLKKMLGHSIEDYCAPSTTGCTGQSSFA